MYFSSLYRRGVRSSQTKTCCLPSIFLSSRLLVRNEFLTNKRELKNIEGRQHVFVCDDFTPLRYKLLKYMQISCSNMFTSCYTRNGNINAKLKTSEKWVTVTSPDDLFKHGIDVDYKQMDCDKILNN